MLDGNVLLRQKRDEVPEGTLSCPDQNLADFHHYRHYEGLRLLPTVCDSKLIQQTLNKEKVENVLLCTPLSLAEQKSIASILTRVDNEITALEAKKAKYEKIKQGMMQQLLTGKIRLIETLHKEKNYCIPESEATCVLAAEP